jgi:hypothetical protein
MGSKCILIRANIRRIMGFVEGACIYSDFTKICVRLPCRMTLILLSVLETNGKTTRSVDVARSSSDHHNSGTDDTSVRRIEKRNRRRSDVAFGFVFRSTRLDSFSRVAQWLVGSVEVAATPFMSCKNVRKVPNHKPLYRTDPSYSNLRDRFDDFF